MKHSFAAAFACLLLLFATEPAFAQQAVYQQYPGSGAGPPADATDPQQTAGYSQGAAQQYAAQQMAAQQYAAQQQLMREQAQMDQAKAIELAVRKAQKASRPTDYELQEQAIQKGLAENKSSQGSNSGSQEPQSTWSSESSSDTGRPSILKGAAVAATKAIGKTAIRALPTVGMIFLARAVSRNGGSVGGATGFSGNYGINGYNSNGSQGFPYGANGLGLNGYGMPYQQYPSYWGR